MRYRANNNDLGCFLVPTFESASEIKHFSRFIIISRHILSSMLSISLFNERFQTTRHLSFKIIESNTIQAIVLLTVSKFTILKIPHDIVH